MSIVPKKYSTIDFDSPEASKKALEIMRTKKCLHDIYVEIYQNMVALKQKYLGSDIEKILEIGSGGGFIKDLYPNIITSDVTDVNCVDIVIDAQKLPFKDNELDAVFAVHVIHHIPDICKFLDEAMRTIKPGGGLVIVEPYWGPLARFLYKNIHPEPFDVKAKDWNLESFGPMSGSNQALSYILLKRDKEKFQKRYPNLKLVYHKAFGCLRYIATGGLWLSPKLPQFMFPFLKGIEFICKPIMPIIGIHHIFVLRKEE